MGGDAVSFIGTLDRHGIDLTPVSVGTLQVNITKLCNQACRHCHVDASPKRTEQMDFRTVQQCLRVLEKTPCIKTLDITGGAPELNPHFDYLVRQGRSLAREVIVRHNLTVTLDGNPQTGEGKEYLPDFFAEQRVTVVSSLPYFQSFFTDKQRGKGVFEKSLESLRRLNARGFGVAGSGLILNLVYNPVGAFLPPNQAALEDQYRAELQNKFGIVFNNLFTITNLPIHRFKDDLVRLNQFDDYQQRLVRAFNPSAAENVMCRSLISVSYDGRLFDCDFNQMLNLELDAAAPRTIFDFKEQDLLLRKIRFSEHCFACTAGCGSSCGGATAA